MNGEKKNNTSQACLSSAGVADSHRVDADSTEADGPLVTRYTWPYTYEVLYTSPVDDDDTTAFNTIASFLVLTPYGYVTVQQDLAIRHHRYINAEGLMSKWLLLAELLVSSFCRAPNTTEHLSFGLSDQRHSPPLPPP